MADRVSHGGVYGADKVWQLLKEDHTVARWDSGRLIKTSYAWTSSCGTT